MDTQKKRTVINKGFYLIKATDTVELFASQYKGHTFRKLFVYPAKGYTAGTGALTDNTNPVRIGYGEESPFVLPDLLSPGDTPLEYQVLAGDPPIRLDTMIISGTQGDGVFFIWFP